MSCAGVVGRGKRTRSSESALSLPPPQVQEDAPAGCSASTMDMELREIRWRLDAVSCGTLKNLRKEVPHLVETLRRITGWLVWGEYHDSSLFDLFCEHSLLAGFVAVLRVHRSPKSVKLQVLQTLSILIQNAQRTTSLIYLLSGGLLNTFFDYPPSLHDEEALAYFITLLKGLVLRLDDELALLCLVKFDASSASRGQEASGNLYRMPIFERSVSFIGHTDPMVHTAARTAVLCILRLEQPILRAATEEASLRLLVPYLAQLAPKNGQGYALSGVASAHGEDLLGFVGDVFRLAIPAINTALECRGFCADASGCVVFSVPVDVQAA